MTYNRSFNYGFNSLCASLWKHNSVGSECYPYKVEVVGSNPTVSTTQGVSSVLVERLPYMQEVHRFEPGTPYNRPYSSVLEERYRDMVEVTSSILVRVTNK